MFRFCKIMGISLFAERLLAFEVGMCCTKFIVVLSGACVTIFFSI